MEFVPHVMTVLRGIAHFLTRREFLTNFSANLGGALCGVLLAFGIERCIARRNAARLYGNILLSVRSELSYLRPQLVYIRDQIKADKTAIRLSAIVPATNTAIISPLVHERAPYSLVMVLTTLSSLADDTNESFRKSVERIQAAPPEVAPVVQVLIHVLGMRVDQLQEIMGIALERIHAELARLKITMQPDPETQDVSRRIREILERTHD